MMKKTLLTLSLGLLAISSLPNTSKASPWSRHPMSVFDDHFWSSFDRMDNFGSTASLDDTKITLTFDMPGLSNRDVDVHVEKDNVLVIKGEKKEKCDKKKKGEESHYRASRSFYKALTLPRDAEIAKITAKVEDGVLTVIVPRKTPPPTAVQKIPVT